MLYPSLCAASKDCPNCSRNVSWTSHDASVFECVTPTPSVPYETLAPVIEYVAPETGMTSAGISVLPSQQQIVQVMQYPYDHSMDENVGSINVVFQDWISEGRFANISLMLLFLKLWKMLSILQDLVDSDREVDSCPAPQSRDLSTVAQNKVVDSHPVPNSLEFEALVCGSDAQDNLVNSDPVADSHLTSP